MPSLRTDAKAKKFVATADLSKFDYPASNR
jgi:hypothetical protein